ncbi:fimbria/pilus outer membrane usher protein [Salmonella enterica subsp. enterica serovar Muenchen]|nr:fimbria/pilus outer membrane usher protein [Salmonella enterica subsp. enterica serovar Muenchen]ECZ7909680.1 fimbria/pilus outer membrane usher protein [Salmonella enterica subsp. enterica serovar Muenchen]
MRICPVYPAATLLGVLVIISHTKDVWAETYSFDISQLDGSNKNIDISLLEQGGQLPGTYLVDILLNGEQTDSREMVFHQGKDLQGKLVLKTCLTRAQLIRYGVRVDDYPELFPSVSADASDMSAQCARLSAIPQATETFRFYNQQLLLSIPQVALRPRLEGIAPQEIWDDGIPAFLANYRFFTDHSEYRWGGNSSSVSNNNVQLEPGINLGPWRIRNLTTWQKQGKHPGDWQSAYTYAERGLYRLKSRLTLGERATSSDVFDSIPFRGGMLETDDAMVPRSQHLFSPVVQGVARSQARIEVRQNGYLIYSTQVAPGPYALNDLSAQDTGGDLQVTLFEADGSQQAYTLPYSTPAIALRQGYMKYSLMAGQYRPAERDVDNVTVGQASVMYGLPWSLTVFGGVQGGQHYQAGSLGMGVSLGDFGAISVDGLQSRGQKQDEKTERGNSWRLRYSKFFDSTHTGVALASYQYASSDYNTMAEVLNTYRSTSDEYRNGARFPDDGHNSKRKTMTSLTISQTLGDLGYLNFSGSRETYWKRHQHQDEVSASYGSTIKDISWSVNWTESRNTGRYLSRRRTENSVSLWVSMPLSRWLGENTYASYQAQTRTGRAPRYDVGLNGYGFDQRLLWDVRGQASSGNKEVSQDSGMVNLSWTGTYGEVTGGYSYSKNNRQVNAGISGSMVAHRHGITLGQTLGQTSALVETSGVSGVVVDGTSGTKTDFRGYTTLGYLSPYQENTITLDPTSLPQNAEIPQTSMQVVPTAGAIVPVTFTTLIGGRAVFSLTQADGSPVPFGSVVSLMSPVGTTSTGITGDGGETYMTGLPESGHLQVRWGNNLQQRCRIDYHLPVQKGGGGVYAIKGRCR